MSYETYASLQVHTDAGVVWLTIDHPPLNLLDAPLMVELNDFAGRVREDAAIRVIVVQSADPEFFIAHGDMGFVDDPARFVALQLGDDDGLPRNPMTRLHERWRTLPQVTIAKLAGFARGGGSELAMALDMRFAAIGKGALAQPETLMGIIPGAGGTSYLPRLVGRARALEIVLGGELFDAQLAERYGWINRALPADALDGFVDTLARRIAALPPGVAAAGKAAVDAADSPLADAITTEEALLAQLFNETAADLSRTARAHGAQTRSGERDLEGLLNALR